MVLGKRGLSSGAQFEGDSNMIAETQFNRPTLNCMVALRRRLKQTMGVTIQMGHPQALENMISLSQT